MLTAEQLGQFNQSGILRMPGAVTKSAADEMLGTVWDCLRERYHIHRDSLDTWPEPEIRPAMQISGAHRFTGTHHLPKSVTFEQLPSTNWHLDFPVSRSTSGLDAVRIFTCLAKLSPGSGGTLFVSGSHRLVQNLVRQGERLASAEARKRLIRAHLWVKALCSRDETDNRVQRFMSNGTAVDGVEVRVVEMTGEPGDVIFTHPMILHAAALNCSSVPRFVLSTTAFRSGLAQVKLYP